MSRLEIFGKPPAVSQKQPAKDPRTPSNTQTHRPVDMVGKKTVIDKPRVSHPALSQPRSAQVSRPETEKPEKVLITEDSNEDLKVKDQRESQPLDSALTGGKTHTSPPVEPLPMQKAHGEEEQTEDEDVGDEDIKAPVELIMEFLRALTDKDFQLAKKLCQMILIYEPDNPEASEFLPLIQKKLLQEAEKTSEDEDEDDDSDDEDEDEDDNNDSTVDSGSEEESSRSSSDSSLSCSSSSSDDDREDDDEEEQVHRHKPCPPSHI